MILFLEPSLFKFDRQPDQGYYLPLSLGNSHASIGAATVTGGSHGGLVAANLSSIDASASSTLSSIGGNSVDLFCFCDSGSMITGGGNIARVPTAQCANLLATGTGPLP